MRVKSGSNSMSGADPPEGSPVGLRAVRACYVPPMILVRIGDVIFPRVLVDTGSGVNVMSNKIHIRLGYHWMAPPTTKLVMADNTLKGARAIIDMDEKVVHIRVSTTLTTVQMTGIAWPGTLRVQSKLSAFDGRGETKGAQEILKSIKWRMKLDAPPQIPAYPEAMNFWEDQFGVLNTPQKLRICIDYRKLNASTVTDAFPYIDLMLESVAGQEMYSFMDGFNGYNQVNMAKRDREKTAFIIEWGAFAYRVMPFGLKNAPSTFQRVVTTAFEEYLNDFMQTYLDDFTIYGSHVDHLGHLWKCLEKCRKYSISLNLDKSMFGVSSGVLLGHIISKDGLLPDPSKIDAILQMEVPSDLKGVQSFIGAIDYYHQFIRDFAHIALPLFDLLQTDQAFEWNKACQVAFKLLKHALVSSPILAIPN
ncbi:hypothetical protein R1flu_021960 [Riccia fluitans]|uniref:Reverse transcriptase domain-containing protein n=1 Tax=Riccia fluitans TaxID=41844 RepID=A0ABD1ZRH2_9MARC